MWTLLLLLVGTLAPQIAAGAQDSEAFRVTGSVAGGPETEVLLLDDNGTTVGRARPGPGGRFAIGVRDPGHYKLALRRGGRLETVEDVQLSSSEPVVTVNVLSAGRSPVVVRRPAEAAIEAGRLFREIPKDARKLFDQGVKRAERGDAKGAIEHLEKAVALAPDFLEALNDLSVQYMRNGDDAKAEAALKRATELDPNSWQPRLNFGLALMLQGRYREALPHLEKAEALSIRSPLPAFHIGRVHLIEGRGTEAEAALDRALQIQPQFPTAQLLRGYARLLAGRLPQGRADLAAYLDQVPQAPDAAHVRRRLERIDSMLRERGQ